jgi:Bacteriophage minor capsid protein
MTSPAKHIADLLQTLNLGTKGTDMFVNFLPETPDNAIAIYDRESEVEPEAKLALDTVKVQIKVRNQSRESAYNKIKSIKLALQSRNDNFTAENNDIYFGFFLQQPISFIETDEKFNSFYTTAFRLNIQPSEKGNRI